MTSEAKEPSNEVDELAAWLIHMADMGDMGRKPDPTCSKRRAAVMLVTLNAEVERWINAYNIAHDQAMDNGRALADCRKCLIKMGENAGTAYKEYAAELATLRARLEVAEREACAAERAKWEPLLSIAETRLTLFEAQAHSELQAALYDVGRLTEVLRDIAGNGDPDFPSYSQAVARSALAGPPSDSGKRGPDCWSVALISAWLRDQDGHGEWREAADAIDAEFICGDVA